MVKRTAIYFLLPVVLACGALFPTQGSAEESNEIAALKSRFEYLSQHGNVECSVQFEKSIAGMPADGKLRGSCCAPMDEARYRQQIEGLEKYSDIAEVPPDPYDIPAPLAYKLMGYYDLALNKEERAPMTMPWSTPTCRARACCKCWRWKVWRSRKVPDPRAPLHWPAGHRPVERWPGLWRSRRYQDALRRL